MKKLSISFKMKIILGFVILGLFSSVAIGTYANLKAKQTIEETVGQTAQDIIKSVTNKIDADKFLQLKTEADMQSDYYKELREQLNSIREATGLKYLYTMRKAEDGKYIYIVDGSPEGSEDESLLGDEEEDVSARMSNSFSGSEAYELEYTKEWGHLISAYIPIKDKAGKTVGIVGADFEANNVVNQLNSLRLNLIIVIIVVVVFGILISSILSTYLVKYLKYLIKQTDYIKAGDLTVEIASKGNDEMGKLAEAFKDMVDSIKGVTKDIKGNSKEVSDHITVLSEDISTTVTATEEITQIINEVAAGAAYQAREVDNISILNHQIVTQMTTAVESARAVLQFSDRAVSYTKEASDILDSSIEKVNIANITVERTANIMKDLGDKSKDISIFSETIAQLAGQTNLLALNAAIEAARAGEQGKGFAVVADEIRKLAEQSNKATTQITSTVKSIQDSIVTAILAIEDGVVQARDGVAAVHQLDNYLDNLESSSLNTNAKIDEIIKLIKAIEQDCLSSMEKIQDVANVSKNFSAGSQNAAAATQEQSAIMTQVDEHLDAINKITLSLASAVNRFKV